MPKKRVKEVKKPTTVSGTAKGAHSGNTVDVDEYRNQIAREYAPEPVKPKNEAKTFVGAGTYLLTAPDGEKQSFKWSTDNNFKVLVTDPKWIAVLEEKGFKELEK